MAILGVAALLLGSCQTPAERAKTSDDGVSAIQFEDIPVPDGLRLQERAHSSDSLELGEYRYANFSYVGGVPVAEVSSYLRDRMPQHKWTLLAEETDPDGNDTLSFRRGKYTAECRLQHEESSARTTLDIVVRTTLDPRRD